jgi:hypothetical protein
MRVIYYINPSVSKQKSVLDILKLYNDCEVVETNGTSFNGLKERLGLKLPPEDSYLIVVNGEKLDGVWKL